MCSIPFFRGASFWTGRSEDGRADRTFVARAVLTLPTLTMNSTTALIATLVAGPANLESVYATSGAVEHTYAVKGALDQLLATMIDAETAQRGFVITVRS